MEHVAIMAKSWGLLPEIVGGQKTIESRWLRNRSAPWDRVSVGDTVYFKNSGEPVTVRATVSQVLQFANVTPDQVAELLDRYGSADGLTAAELPHYKELFRNKKYCVLIFLDHVEEIEPFQIDKRGFGLQAAWLTVKSIDTLTA